MKLWLVVIALMTVSIVVLALCTDPAFTGAGFIVGVVQGILSRLAAEGLVRA